MAESYIKKKNDQSESGFQIRYINDFVGKELAIVPALIILNSSDGNLKRVYRPISYIIYSISRLPAYQSNLI